MPFGLLKRPRFSFLIHAQFSRFHSTAFTFDLASPLHLGRNVEEKSSSSFPTVHSHTHTRHKLILVSSVGDCEEILGIPDYCTPDSNFPPFRHIMHIALPFLFSTFSSFFFLLLLHNSFLLQPSAELLYAAAQFSTHNVPAYTQYRQAEE